jgi:hypothetical protein
MKPMILVRKSNITCKWGMEFQIFYKGSGNNFLIIFMVFYIYCNDNGIVSNNVTLQLFQEISHSATSMGFFASTKYTVRNLYLITITIKLASCRLKMTTVETAKCLYFASMIKVKYYNIRCFWLDF